MPEYWPICLVTTTPIILWPLVLPTIFQQISDSFRSLFYPGACKRTTYVRTYVTMYFAIICDIRKYVRPRYVCAHRSVWRLVRTQWTEMVSVSVCTQIMLLLLGRQNCLFHLLPIDCCCIFIRGKTGLSEAEKEKTRRRSFLACLKSEVCLNKHAKYYVLNSSFLIRTCMYYIRTYVHRSIDRSFSCVTDVWLSVCLSAWNNEKIYLTIDGYAAAKLTGNKQLINIQTTFRLYI